MDRNTVIGFSLLAVLLVVYVTYNQHSQTKYLEQKRADSVAYAKAHPHTIIDSSKVVKLDTTVSHAADSLRKLMPPAYNGTAQTITVENKKLAIAFTTKGAYPVSAQLKDYKTYSRKPLYLFNGTGNSLSAILPVDNGRSTADLYFTPVIKDEPNGNKTVDFTADMGAGKKVDIIYTLPADDYMVQCSVHLTGMSASALPMTLQLMALHTEKDIKSERMYSQEYYQYKNGDHDYFTARNADKKTLSEPTKWIGLRKQYFNSILESDDGFNRVDFINNPAPADSVNVTVLNRTSMEVPIKAGVNTASFNWYIGPNDYRVLRSYKMDFEDMVPMGVGITAFVKYINKYLLLNIFFFLTSFIGNYALIIILLTVFIRLITSFFTYKSYLSAAKMRVLKPEIDALKAKYGDDQQKFGTEQMKLWKSAGVNPLGGCLPTLFQMPILLALYYLFPSMIEFRQKSFLWAPDLSTYDSIANLPFNIPFYGDHVSLFTLLMTASSLFLALYNRNMTGGADMNNNPAMKYMPYVMPFMFLGIFNKMAAALTFYYFFSNTLSILQQFIIQKYFIDEKAIHAQMQENRSKPVAQSKWSQKMEEIQKANAERMKQQQTRRK